MYNDIGLTYLNNSPIIFYSKLITDKVVGDVWFEKTIGIRNNELFKPESVP